MFWLLFLVYVVNSLNQPWRISAVPSCTEIPPGSTMKENNGNIVTFQEPVPTGKCEVNTNAQGHTFAQQFNCTGSTAYQNFYPNAKSCSGNSGGSNPITVKGTCATGGCAGFTATQYGTPDCSGTATDTRTNEYFYWGDGTCQYNMTQACVGGKPQVKFFNNAACTGNAVFTMTAGVCNKRNGRSSEMMTATDSPC